MVTFYPIKYDANCIFENYVYWLEEISFYSLLAEMFQYK